MHFLRCMQAITVVCLDIFAWVCASTEHTFSWSTSNYTTAFRFLYFKLVFICKKAEKEGHSTILN